jgi:hypothetical protein
VAHRPIEATPEVTREWGSEVAFIGTWMPERGPFLARLLELGVPLSIRGNRWEKAPEWKRLSGAWRGPAVYGDEYVAATQFSRVSIGLLSKGNRDLHTQRSAEIPAIGGAACCAEHTDEHEAMLINGLEAELFKGPEECASKCAKLLADEPLRRSMTAAALAKVSRLKLSNDEVIRSILEAHESARCTCPEPWGLEIHEGDHSAVRSKFGNAALAKSLPNGVGPQTS